MTEHAATTLKHPPTPTTARRINATTISILLITPCYPATTVWPAALTALTPPSTAAAHTRCQQTKHEIADYASPCAIAFIHCDGSIAPEEITAAG
jgi:hypothetical protein